MTPSFAEKTMRFYQQLHLPDGLDKGIEVLNPYVKEDVQQACHQFYHRFYDDHTPRRIILGINPGRFGAGITGIPFTDPIRLTEDCGIENRFEKKGELSAQFIYMLIDVMGGPELFYKRYFIGAVSPLGFTKNGKNFNYYDDLKFQRKLKPFIVRSLVQQVALGIKTEKCYCLGQGKNYAYLQQLNQELNLFGEVIPLPHPRWVMQYRRKQLDHYLTEISRLLTV
jgi:hypothetical protein